MVLHLSDQDPSSKDLSSLVDPVPDFSWSINNINGYNYLEQLSFKSKVK